MKNVSELRLVRVTRKKVEAEGICSFELVAEHGVPLPEFSAGAHVIVHLENGVSRPYSLCNDPAESGRYVIAVLKEPKSRGGSIAMHALAEGATVYVSDPRNNFCLANEAERHLLFAGGIGVTPLLAMACRLWRSGADFELHVSCRTQARAPFVQKLRESPFSHKVHFHFDDGPSVQKLDIEHLLANPGDGVHLYACGPQGYMDHILSNARMASWKEAQIHFESFSADLSVHADDASFEIEIASTGQVLQVGKGETVANVLFDHGIDLPLSCEMGVCGTCVTRVLAGIPDHRDMYLTPEEQSRNDQFTACCSRSKTSRLVLDL